jgi:hypothetical protein
MVCWAAYILRERWMGLWADSKTKKKCSSTFVLLHLGPVADSMSSSMLDDAMHMSIVYTKLKLPNQL